MSKHPSFRYALIFVCAVLALAPARPAHAQSAFDDPGARGGASASTQGGDLKPVKDKLDAGDVALGSSTQVVVLFRNDDVKPIKTGLINLYPSSNITAAVGENQCATDAIQPGEVCAISIQVKGLQQGNYRIEMLMRHDGRAKLLTTTINGNVKTGDAQTKDLVSDIEIIPAQIDFGDLDESHSQSKAVILRNKTSKPITINDLHIEAGSQSGFSVSSNCKELQTGAACVASVSWMPQQKGPSTGTLIVSHSGATEIATVDITGSFDPDDTETAEIFPESVPGKGLLISTQEVIDFGTGVSESSSITVSLVNVGDMPVTITGIRMTNSESGVRAEKVGCRAGTVLAPLEACPLTMTWEPLREGMIVDDVQILHTGARGVLVMPLRGTASRPVNKDKKAIMLTGNIAGPEAIISNIQPLSLSDVEEPGEEVMEAGEKATVDKKGAASSSDKKAKSAAKTVKSGPSATSEMDTDAAPAQTMTTRRAPQIDVRGLLDGYVITSYSPSRAIVSGPGGSRVVFNGEQTVIGGVLWEITMRPSAIEFRHDDQKVLLLFDRSLSSVNLIDTQSDNGSSGSTQTSGPPTSSSSSSSSRSSSSRSSGTQ